MKYTAIIVANTGHKGTANMHQNYDAYLHTYARGFFPLNQNVCKQTHHIKH